MFIMRDIILDQPLKSYRDYDDLQNILSSSDLAALNALGVEVSIYIDSKEEVTIGFTKYLGLGSETAHYFTFAPSEIKLEYTFEAKQATRDKFILGDIIDIGSYFHTRDIEYAKIINNQIIDENGLRSVVMAGYIDLLRKFVDSFNEDLTNFFVGINLINAKFSKVSIPEKELYNKFEVPGVRVKLIESDGDETILAEDDLFSLNTSHLKEDLKWTAANIGNEIMSESRDFMIETDYKQDVPPQIRYRRVAIEIKSIKEEVMLIELM